MNTKYLSPGEERAKIQFQGFTKLITMPPTIVAQLAATLETDNLPTLTLKRILNGALNYAHPEHS